MGNSSSQKFKIFVGIVAIIAMASVLKSFLIKKDQKEVTRIKNERTLGMISKLMILPAEEPVIAIVKGADQLRKEQPFYANVENGDQLLLFPRARQAIIYSPVKNIIVNAGSLTVNDQDSTESQNKK